MVLNQYCMCILRNIVYTAHHVRLWIISEIWQKDVLLLMHNQLTIISVVSIPAFKI